MAIYILDGGGIRTSADEGRLLFSEFVHGIDDPKVLLCFFAQPESLWKEKYTDWTERIRSLLPDLRISFEMAQLNNFEEQCSRNNLLYVYGGDNGLLIDRIKKIKNYRSLFSGFNKVLGSSAGAIMLSKYSWACDSREVEKGLGFVNCKTLVHWKSPTYGMGDPRGAIDWNVAAEQLSAYEDELPTYALEEGQFVVV